MTEGGPRNRGTVLSDEASHHDSGGLLNEILYCMASFQAIFTPVSITMILSALAVVNINTDETRAQGEAAYAQTYQVMDLEEGNSSQNLAASLVNVSIIVSVICLMTFVIVILYKYGCMKIFMGYMVLVTAMLLGYFTATMADVAIQKYNIRFDKLSFVYLIWNYAVVGVISIFFNRGIPKFVTQGYLVTSSVVVAWQLSYMNDWTAWTMLVMLALYDLFAVLSPCGPLKALTQLMSRPGARPLPGLLYEASLPTGVQRPSRNSDEANNTENHEEPPQPSSGNSDRTVSTHRFHEANDRSDSSSSPSAPDSTRPMAINERIPDDEQSASDDQGVSARFAWNDDSSRNQQSDQPPSHGIMRSTGLSASAPHQCTTQQEVEATISSTTSPTSSTRGRIPLALAKLYKLAVIDDDGVLRQRGQLEQDVYTPEEISERTWTARQLRAEVTVIFPERGGRIVAADDQDSNEGRKYFVFNRAGDLLRTFVVNRQGQVMQVVRREPGSSKEDNSIKLGLGDFIFYSVLVSKAALQSFTAFAACMLTILFGLGGTLVLLAVHGKALPALPISIFLAVLTFVLIRYVTEPYIQEVLRYPLYV